jgi:hypothetical protein
MERLEIPVWKRNGYWAFKFEEIITVIPSGCIFDRKNDLVDEFFNIVLDELRWRRKETKKDYTERDFMQYVFVAREPISFSVKNTKIKYSYPGEFTLNSMNDYYKFLTECRFKEREDRKLRARIEKSLRGNEI